MIQARATQLLREAHESNRAKDAKIRNLEAYISTLEAKLDRDPRLPESSDKQLRSVTRQEPQAGADGIARLVQGSIPYQLHQVAVELVLLKAGVAQSQRDWPAMERHSERAAELAKSLSNEPVSARCSFNRAIALFGQREWASSYQAFEDAAPCFGVDVSIEEAEEWRQKVVRALNESPSQSSYAPSIPSVRESTPIDQSLFQGFESVQTMFSLPESPISVPPTATSVPVIRQPLSPSVLRSRRGTQGGVIYVPPMIDSTTGSTRFEPTHRDADQTTQASRIRAVGGGNFPQVQSSAAPSSSDEFLPLNESRSSRFAAHPNLMAELEMGGESSRPLPVRPAAKRFSIESGSPPSHMGVDPFRATTALSRSGEGSTRSNHGSIRNRSQRSSGLSVHFEPQWKISEPSVGSNAPRELVKETEQLPLASSPSSSQVLPSIERLIRPAKRFALSSNSSPSQLVSPHGGANPVHQAFPTTSGDTALSGTSYVGSSSMSPQVNPPDLHDSREELSVLKMPDASPELNPFKSNGQPGDVLERNITPLTEEALSRLAKRAGLAAEPASIQRSHYGLQVSAAEGPAMQGSRSAISLARQHADGELQGLKSEGPASQGPKYAESPSVEHSAVELQGPTSQGPPLRGLGLPGGQRLLTTLENDSGAASDIRGEIETTGEATTPSRLPQHMGELSSELHGSDQSNGEERITDEIGKQINQSPFADVRRNANTLPSKKAIDKKDGDGSKESKNTSDSWSVLTKETDSGKPSIQEMSTSGTRTSSSADEEG